MNPTVYTARVCRWTFQSLQPFTHTSVILQHIQGAFVLAVHQSQTRSGWERSSPPVTAAWRILSLFAVKMFRDTVNLLSFHFNLLLHGKKTHHKSSETPAGQREPPQRFPRCLAQRRWECWLALMPQTWLNADSHRYSDEAFMSSPTNWIYRKQDSFCFAS